ncbi:hypothetical protein CFHF_15650 [Caulobacter flavus]|jgi:hypothetical protein|uniref:Uncharacterized protein n=1 Tax=Caulobacter flavus TaxID=1679497 RepID=A0A2N5CRJ5_9CAUL|nr:hypothetical protein [Caulobacter flavus]AYV46334.1 hypothetical protein C1707_08730 [Caulobacter flavus]PLR12003.1 hypothetical protein CFHF_15650 [Caulobacter flavus]
MLARRMRAAVVMALALAGAAQAAEGYTHYANKNWMYVVILPGKVKLVTSKPPMPNHGFAVNLSRRARLWVDAGSTDGETLAQAVDEQVGVWRGAGCVELGRADDRLGGRPAVRLLLRCQAKGETNLQRMVIALAAPVGMNNTAYTVGVSYREHGPKAEADRADALLEDARAGFRFIGEDGSPPLG